jgi:hypothetical protein
MDLSQEAQTKYVVDIRPVEKAIITPKEFVQELKGAVGGKQMARMKKEAVDCPVWQKNLSFVQCFACPNFLRRVKGKVDCRGLPLPGSPPAKA